MIRAVLDRIESGVAVLEFEDGSILMIPDDELPEGLCEGEFVLVRVERAPQQAAESDRASSG